MKNPIVIEDATAGVIETSGRVNNHFASTIKDVLYNNSEGSILSIVRDSYIKSGTSFIYFANENGDIVLYTNINNKEDWKEADRKIYYENSTDTINKLLNLYRGECDILVVDGFDSSSSDGVTTNKLVM